MWINKIDFLWQSRMFVRSDIKLLSYFLSEVYFSEVKYISISHFLWKKSIFQNNDESLQVGVVQFFYGKLVLYYSNNDCQTQNFTYHHLLPHNVRLIVTNFAPIFNKPDIAQLLFTSWALPTNWGQFRDWDLSEHVKIKDTFNFYFRYILIIHKKCWRFAHQ